MEIIKTKIKDLQIVKQKNNLDKRGSLKVIFNDKFLKIKDLNMNIILYQKKTLSEDFTFKQKISK